jgi:uncharacterized membrane protein YagU involved in acid resistance
MAMSLGRAFGDFGCVIGKGLLAGLAGTAAITLAQEVEMALVVLPKVEVTPPAREWPVQMHLTEAVIHLIYATAAGAAYDLMSEEL